MALQDKNPKPDTLSRGQDTRLPVPGAEFAQKLKTWRRLNNIKQAALADMLGVSQTTISFWETGRDLPSQASMARLNDMMTDASRKELAVERLFINRQAGTRALFDLDGVSLQAASAGFCSLWPEYARLEGRFMADHLVNEALMLTSDPHLRQAILKGELGLVSGVSSRMTDLELDEAVLHRWHMCFRRQGYRTLVEIVYEPCQTEEQEGIVDLVYLEPAKRK